MRAAFALRIFSGKIIYNFAILENLRIFQNCLFTGGVVKANGICSACFLWKRRRCGESFCCPAAGCSLIRLLPLVAATFPRLGEGFGAPAYFTL